MATSILQEEQPVRQMSTGLLMNVLPNQVCKFVSILKKDRKYSDKQSSTSRQLLQIQRNNLSSYHYVKLRMTRTVSQ